MPESTRSGTPKVCIVSNDDGTPVGGTSGNVTAAVATATLAAAVGKTNYLTGFEVTGAGATGASVIIGTVVGLAGGTRSFNLAIPAGAAVGVTPLIVEGLNLPASGPNVAIVVSFPSFGAGNTNACVNASGYQV